MSNGTHPIDVSICIVNWNGRELVRALLDSIEDTCADLSAEVIIIDNASTDGAPDMIEADFPSVRLVRNTDNVGFARANNQAADLANGRLLFFLNNDTVLKPDSLGRLVRFLDEHREASAVGPKLVGADGSVQASVRNHFTLGAVLHQIRLSRWTGLFNRAYRRYAATDFDYSLTQAATHIAAAALLVRNRHFVECGRWDESFQFSVEDVDLNIRLGKLGPIYFLAESTVIHYGRISSKANNAFAYRGEKLGFARLLDKHHPWKSSALLYKTMLTADLPFRIVILGLEFCWQKAVSRHGKARRTFDRFMAAYAFMRHDLRRFWAS